MTTPTLREIINTFLSLEDHGNSSMFDDMVLHTIQQARAALAAQPELPEPVAVLVRRNVTGQASPFGGVRGFSWLEEVEQPNEKGAFPVYTAAQLQQAVEQTKQTEPTDSWRDLALQFDGHRMRALGWLKVILKDAPESEWQGAREFLNAPPLSGEKVLAERISSQAKREPMARDQMRDIFLANGFTVKEGQDDLKDYVYTAGRAIEAHHGIGDKA